MNVHLILCQKKQPGNRYAIDSVSMDTDHVSCKLNESSSFIFNYKVLILRKCYGNVVFLNNLNESSDIMFVLIKNCDGSGISETWEANTKGGCQPNI